ncbi:hypothetical protein B4N89_00400 [Embleya scabrispora]|uniref:Uncharacterized protein n=1 Tax=Embleya scabrispora TaxID=159449 RepID=A0A1T3NSF5_9ACTN|nr:hypothetical protein B4N89_00400 [Embleya scabrispora]
MNNTRAHQISPLPGCIWRRRHIALRRLTNSRPRRVPCPARTWETWRNDQRPVAAIPGSDPALRGRPHARPAPPMDLLLG